MLQEIFPFPKWGHTQAITEENKAALLQQLILEEVIVHLEDNLKAFIIQLEWLGLRGEVPIHSPGPSTSSQQINFRW